MRDEIRGHGSINFNFFFSCAFAFLSWVAWPKSQGEYFGTGLIAGFLALGAALAAAKGIAALGVKYRRRRAKIKAQRSTESLGSAKYLDLPGRAAAGVHDLKNPILAGLCDGLPVTVPEYLPVACEAGAGQGKTSNIVTASLFHAVMNGWSVVVPDSKPELAYLLGKTLDEMGVRVAYNNASGHPDFPDHKDSNPFAPLVEAAETVDGHKQLFNLANTIALPLIPDPKGEAQKNRFFILNERSALVCVLICLAIFHPERCYPSQALRALTDKHVFRNLCQMAASNPDILDGDLAALGSSFLDKEVNNIEHYESALSGAAQSLENFRASSTLGMVGATHDIDPKELRDESKPPLVIFDIMQADQLDVFAKPNAVLQTSRLQALRRHKEGRKVLFLCDEATNLPIPSVVKDIELMRSFGVRLSLFYQSEASLRRTYGDQQAEAILSNAAEIFFSCANLKRAKELSERLGQKTIKTNNHSFAEDGTPSESIGETTRSLLNPDEILSLSSNEALMFLPGKRAIRFEKVPYYQAEPFKSLVGKNPNENHPPSPITRYRLVYGKDASQLGPPVLPDWRQRHAHAKAVEAAKRKQPKARLFYLRDWVWVPLVIVVAEAIFLLGTPHILLGAHTHASYNECAYTGLSGYRVIEQSAPCETIETLRFQKTEAG